MKSPLRWPGGKGRLAPVILQYMPPHEAYVETCCGGAAVFWAKPKEWSKAEVLNDADGELINFYYILHKHGRRLAREVDSMPYSRALFYRLRDSKPRSPFRRAVRFWYVNRVAFGAIGGSFGPRAQRRSYVLPASVLLQLDGTVERLRGTLFESVDVVRLVKLYDRPGTFFYIDPPYWGIHGLYRCDFTTEDHGRLAAALKAAAGCWVLSYNDCQEIRRLYRGCKRRRVTTRYYNRGNDPKYRAHSLADELLISNRPCRRVKHR